ncbi:hypothetical protein [Tritonibacter mobilis]|uniref:hypothetical protein n=1 Tax=Tritonibacter mobilis TaxID=379347 RepID=UPI001C0870CB|nr:hypothetical protein [Tritonibacter mobilis]MBU3033704.1 hypothetical protein [Tritonibacter mobilis]WHQ84320.1 hypothetical protein OMR53_19375 [Tritonibacter mobilis]
MTGSSIVSIVSLFSAVWFATPVFSDQTCFKQAFIKNWAKKFSYSEALAKEVVYSSEMPDALDAIYHRYIDRALASGDARNTFEVFEVEWNIEGYNSQIPDDLLL